MSFQTAQEEFWAGEFGNDYIGRNQGAGWVAANTALFSAVLRQVRDVNSVLEFGPNIGLNLQAIHQLLPDAELTGVEINPTAAEKLRGLGYVDVVGRSVFDFEVTRKWDLTFTKGVMIHLAPERIGEAYEKLHAASARYIVVAEYYNPAPVELNYRGHAGRLFKRDFAGDMLDRFSDLRLVDYGFAYRRDPNFPQDDITWFLLEKV